jgi:hypothetical protein
MAQWVILCNVFVRQVRQETVTGACVKHYLTHSAVELRQAIIETVSGKTTPTPQTNPLALLLTNPTMIRTLMVLLIMVLLITPTPPLIRALKEIENNNFVVVGLKEN